MDKFMEKKIETQSELIDALSEVLEYYAELGTVTNIELQGALVQLSNLYSYYQFKNSDNKDKGDYPYNGN